MLDGMPIETQLSVLLYSAMFILILLGTAAAIGLAALINWAIDRWGDG